MPIRIGAYGATGYTGLELVRLLKSHPEVTIHFVTSESMAGHSLRESWPLAPDIPLIPAELAPLSEVQGIFLCLPNSQAAPIAAHAALQGVRIIDLSADLRLNDPDMYATWYGTPHPAPHLLPAPYGLPEIASRNVLAQAALIANPGCYATAILLGLVPVVRARLLRPDAPVIVDAKSGVSGAGRAPKLHILFGEVHGNLTPYKIGRAHRHLPEVEQVLTEHGMPPGQIVFSPHLLPTDRGILATIYVQVTHAKRVGQVFEDAYAAEPLVDVLPVGEIATLGHVVRTPRAVISLTAVTDELTIIVVAIDNLLKGAASQAVQNFNLMWRLPETCGLLPS